jgi:hypothetical protein
VQLNGLSSGEPLRRNPITGTAGCCARAITGHAAAPPSPAMNSPVASLIPRADQGSLSWSGLTGNQQFAPAEMPLPSPRGLTGAFFLAPGPRGLACQDARARDWYGSADQAGDGSGVIADSAANRASWRSGQPCYFCNMLEPERTATRTFFAHFGTNRTQGLNGDTVGGVE